jgi:hypothetical protein
MISRSLNEFSDLFCLVERAIDYFLYCNYLELFHIVELIYLVALFDCYSTVRNIRAKTVFCFSLE